MYERVLNQSWIQTPTLFHFFNSHTIKKKLLLEHYCVVSPPLAWYHITVIIYPTLFSFLLFRELSFFPQHRPASESNLNENIARKDFCANTQWKRRRVCSGLVVVSPGQFVSRQVATCQLHFRSETLWWWVATPDCPPVWRYLLFSNWGEKAGGVYVTVCGKRVDVLFKIGWSVDNTTKQSHAWKCSNLFLKCDVWNMKCDLPDRKSHRSS